MEPREIQRVLRSAIRKIEPEAAMFSDRLQILVDAAIADLEQSI